MLPSRSRMAMRNDAWSRFPYSSELCHGYVMGALRLFLALSVLNGHQTFLYGYFLFNAYVAVCVFYVISGFYIAMVLDGNYKRRIGTFYLNRILRLFPVWWA